MPSLGFSWGLPLPIGPVMMSYHFLPRLCLFWVSHPISSFPTETFLHMHYRPGWRLCWLHSSSSPWRMNITGSQHTSIQNMSYTQVHVYKVSVCLWCLASIFALIQLSHPLTCAYSTNLIFFLRWWTGHLRRHSQPYKAHLPYQLQSCKAQTVLLGGHMLLLRSRPSCGCAPCLSEF